MLIFYEITLYIYTHTIYLSRLSIKINILKYKIILISTFEDIEIILGILIYIFQVKE